MRLIRPTALATLTLVASACTPTDVAEGGPASAPAPAAEAVPAPAPVAEPAPAAAVVDQAAGQALFNDWSCGTCHTLAAAGGTGGVGPSFDGNAKLTVDYAKGLITNGQGAMPAFGGQMTDAEIATIASYIVAVKK